MSEELRPCPFCGGTNICTEKGINLNYCDSCSAEANIEHWNTRPIEDDLRKRIAELEAENAELKPYRDGYDAYEDFPEEGENVIANLGNWFLLAQRRGDKWYDSLGQQAEIRGGIERWWKLPEVQE